MENRCVCCGAIIPEGRMVCPICEMDADEILFVRPQGAAYFRVSAKGNGGNLIITFDEPIE